MRTKTVTQDARMSFAISKTNSLCLSLSRGHGAQIAVAFTKALASSRGFAIECVELAMPLTAVKADSVGLKLLQEVVRYFTLFVLVATS